METIAKNNQITEAGEYIVWSGPPGARVIIEIEGVLGGAVVTLGRESIAGTFRAYAVADEPVTLEPGDFEFVVMGARGVVALKVVGGDQTTDIRVAVSKFRGDYYM